MYGLGQTPEKVCLSALEELSRERATPSLRIQAWSFSSLSRGHIQWCEHFLFSSVPAKLENCSPGWMELLFCSLRLSPSGWTMHPGIGLEPKGCMGSWDREGPQPSPSSLSSPRSGKQLRPSTPGSFAWHVVHTDGERQPVVMWMCCSPTRMAALTRASSAASWTASGSKV